MFTVERAGPRPGRAVRRPYLALRIKADLYSIRVACGCGGVHSSAPHGAPAHRPTLTQLIRQLAKQNPTWGYQRIQGDLLKLGSRIDETSWRAVGDRATPDPRREDMAVSVRANTDRGGPDAVAG
jgi:hypothetical protein